MSTFVSPSQAGADKTVGKLIAEAVPRCVLQHTPRQGRNENRDRLGPSRSPRDGWLNVQSGTRKWEGRRGPRGIPPMPRARERVGVLGAAPGVELDSNTTVHCRNHYPGRRHAAGKATSLGCTH